MAAIERAYVERSLPHFFVSKAVRAHDSEPWKLAAQLIHFQQCGGFKVHYGDAGAVLGDHVAGFIEVARGGNPLEVLLQGAAHGFGQASIALQHYDIERFHKTPTGEVPSCDGG